MASTSNVIHSVTTRVSPMLPASLEANHSFTDISGDDSLEELLIPNATLAIGIFKDLIENFLRVHFSDLKNAITVSNRYNPKLSHCTTYINAILVLNY